MSKCDFQYVRGHERKEFVLQTMVQKNKQDFEMALQKVSKEKKDEKNGKDRMLLAV